MLRLCALFVLYNGNCFDKVVLFNSRISVGEFSFRVFWSLFFFLQECTLRVLGVCVGSRVHACVYTFRYIRGAFNKFPDFLYRHLELSWTLENSLCYCYISYEMTDQFL